MLDDYRTSVKCEEADINNEIMCRAEKISRIESDLQRVEQEIARAEAARQEVLLRASAASAPAAAPCFRLTMSSCSAWTSALKSPQKLPLLSPA